ncbi:Protein NUCLEAR FUSION DEFECTIVE 4, partial [Cucurbita argyrosperma subsp. sororia]
MGNNRGGESWLFVKQVVEGRWFSVFTSFLIMIGCGSPYLFGTYSKLLKAKFDYNQTQLNTLGFAKDLGSNLGVFAGLFAEVAPPWMLFLVGISSNFFSYFMIWLSVSNYVSKPQLWLMFVYIYITSNSQNFPNTAVMVTSVGNFPDQRGIILGLLKGFVGLGGAILTQINLAIYGNQNSMDLLLLLSWLPSIVCSLCFLPIRTIKARKHPQELKVFYHLLYVSIAIAVFLLFLTITQRNIAFSQAGYAGGVAVIGVLICLPLLIAIKEELFLFKLGKQTMNPSVVVSIPREQLKEISKISLRSVSNVCKEPQRGEDFSILQALLSKDMALIFIATVSACGSSVAAIDNLGQIAESLEYPNHSIIYVASLIIGFGLGAQTPLIFAIISDLFGLKHYSTLLNCGQLAVPLGSYIMNVEVIGRFYDAEATKIGNVKNGKGLTCTGTHCFSESFMILAAVTLFGAMASFVLAYRTRDFYKGDVYKKCRDDIGVTQSNVELYSVDDRNNEHKKITDDRSK